MPQLYPLGPDVSEEEYQAYHGQHSPGYVSPTVGYDEFNGDLEAFLKYKADNGSDSDYDRYMNFLENEYSLQKGRDWTASREDSQYQRLTEDLKKAGINPYALLQNGASPVSSSSGGASYSGSYSSNEALKKEANSQKWLSLLTTVVTTVIIAAAMAA